MQQRSSTTRSKRVLIVSTHAIQYMGPLYRCMAAHPRIEPLVAYCSLQGAEAGRDPEFGVQVKWDVPLLEGYNWLQLPNRSPFPGLGKFFGLINPGLWPLITSGRFDGVLIYGYANLSYWIAILAARWSGTPLLLGTDATTIEPREGGRWKIPLKRALLPRIFALADVAVAPSTAGTRFLRSLGLHPDRIALLHYTVDNAGFAEAAAASDRAATRHAWGVPLSAPCVLFCGKLQPWKRPQDLLRALASCGVDNAYVVFAGDGPLRADLERESAALGLAGRARFVGFVNQSQLPAAYAAADLLVLPSAHEPWGLVVNEAMACGRAAVVTDKVGAHGDLIEEGVTGCVYPAGDHVRLSQILAALLPNPPKLRSMGEAASRRIGSWSYRDYIEALLQALDSAAVAPDGDRELGAAA